MKMSQAKNERIKRFSLPFRIAHWINAFAFFMLYLTGLPMYTEFFDWLYPILGGPASGRLMHRIFGIMFIIPTIFMILTDPKSFFHWIKSMFIWKKEDFAFFLPFAKEFFGKHAKIPKQDFYNAGEKLNSILQVVTAILLIGSGFMMWFPQLLPYAFQVWAYPIHNMSFGLAAAVIVGHIYLSTLGPGGKDALRGMIKGDVPEDFAKEHHGKWYDELQKKDKQGA